MTACFRSKEVVPIDRKTLHKGDFKFIVLTRRYQEIIRTA